MAENDATCHYLFLYNKNIDNDIQRQTIIDSLGKEQMEFVVGMMHELLSTRAKCPKGMQRRLQNDYIHLRKLLQNNGENSNLKLSLRDKKNILRQTNGLTVGWLCKFCCQQRKERKKKK